MIVIEPITAANALVFKETRLRALRDSPNAFGSTYAEESHLADDDWIRRAKEWNSERGAGFLAMEDRIACGIAGSFLDQDDEKRAHLVSMWTAPSHRGRGVGRLLVEKIADWAASRNAQLLLLTVVCNNEAAISFYRRLGFELSGRTQPYPNDPALIEYEMSKPIG